MLLSKTERVIILGSFFVFGAGFVAGSIATMFVISLLVANNLDEVGDEGSSK